MPAVIPLVWSSITAPLFWTIIPLLVGGFVGKLGYSPEMAGIIASVQLAAMMATNILEVMTVHRWNLRQAAIGALEQMGVFPQIGEGAV